MACGVIAVFKAGKLSNLQTAREAKVSDNFGDRATWGC